MKIFRFDIMSASYGRGFLQRPSWAFLIIDYLRWHTLSLGLYEGTTSVFRLVLIYNLQNVHTLCEGIHFEIFFNWLLTLKKGYISHPTTTTRLLTLYFGTIGQTSDIANGLTVSYYKTETTVNKKIEREPHQWLNSSVYIIAQPIAKPLRKFQENCLQVFLHPWNSFLSVTEAKKI